MDNLRLFVGIRPPEAVVDEIHRTRTQLESQMGGRAVRWIPAKNYHLTLHFLGDTPPALAGDVQAAMHDAAELSTEPADLSLHEVSAFPNPGRARVLVVTVDDHGSALERIAGRLVLALRGRLGDESVRTDDRPFTPHLTLGYLRRSATAGDRRAIGPALRSARIDQIRFRANRLLLVQSVPGPDGSRYTEIDSATLGVTSREQP